jgi:hypothetical protein
LPNFTIGVRTQKNHFGFDFSADLFTIHYITSLKITPSFLYYPKPKLNSQFYYGVGFTAGELFPDKKFFKKSLTYLSPELIFGKKYQNENNENRFWQLTIDFPTFGFENYKNKTCKTLYYPIVFLKYGVAF